MVQAHNSDAAAAWGHAGADYDFISFGLSDALSHAVQALWPKPGERILDVATGTGWTARLAAMQGATVTGVDIADPLLDAARELSNHITPALEFRHGDAEALPFDDGVFDGVISTYGVIFAGQPKAAAAELARVSKPGGRLVLLTWQDDPAGYIPLFFAMVGKYAGGPPPETSPLDWGKADWLAQTLGEDFELTISERITTLFAPDADTLWSKYRNGFGPMDLTVSSLSLDDVQAFQQDFRDLHAPYDTGHGLVIDRKALLVQGVRRDTR
ncbi:MAG: methyltransferase domain-containing protein [Pseudomonadota bacterium]